MEKQNRVEVSDALSLLKSSRVSSVTAVYADPPYTKDQYSRYYHVYETMYRIRLSDILRRRPCSP